MQTKSVIVADDTPVTASSSSSTTSRLTTAVLPPADHNDIVERAAFVIWLGIFTLLAVFLLLVITLLFFPTTGQDFNIALVEMIGGTILGASAIFWATISAVAIIIFLVLASIFGIVMLVASIIQLMNFISFLTTDTNEPTSTILINIIRQTFLVIIAFIFLGLAIAFIVMAAHYYSALKRKARIEKEVIVQDEEETETTTEFEAAAVPTQSMITFTGVRHRTGFGVQL